ncbi:MAG: hypothetical protein PHT00_01415 [Candidatus Methanomethylophilus sp.]|nr:hypothetical protein [Methanomethylophilus sp.]
MTHEDRDGLDVKSGVDVALPERPAQHPVIEGNAGGRPELCSGQTVPQQEIQEPVVVGRTQRIKPNMTGNGP